MNNKKMHIRKAEFITVNVMLAWWFLIKTLIRVQVWFGTQRSNNQQVKKKQKTNTNRSLVGM